MPLDNERLMHCFTVTFPSATNSEITNERIEDLPGWDSLRGVTLLAVIDEEFGFQMDLDQLISAGTFKGVLDHLEQHGAH